MEKQNRKSSCLILIDTKGSNNCQNTKEICPKVTICLFAALQFGATKNPYFPTVKIMLNLIHIHDITHYHCITLMANSIILFSKSIRLLDRVHQHFEFSTAFTATNTIERNNCTKCTSNHIFIAIYFLLHSILLWFVSDCLF